MVDLVTGGAGFVGSNLVEGLEKAMILDDFSTANRYSSEFARASDARVIEGSVADYETVRKALEGVRTVYHQAAVPSVPRSVKNPLATNRANAGGTVTLLKACADAGVESVVYASSSSVYGDTPTLPKTEDMKPRPKSPYAVSKLAGEHYMRVFGELYGLKTASLRYFNVFGPRQNPDSQYSAVIPRFVKAALSGQPLTVYGDGEQTRDFTYVRDVVEANKKAAGKSGVYNISGGKQTTVNELAELVISLTDSSSKIERAGERKGDVRHSLGDISKARKGLGWKPKNSLEEGLKEYIMRFPKTKTKQLKR